MYALLYTSSGRRNTRALLEERAKWRGTFLAANRDCRNRGMWGVREGRGDGEVGEDDDGATGNAPGWVESCSRN